MRKFNAQDAQILLQAAQSAPLQNFRAAQELGLLFARFTLFCNEQFAEKPAAEAAAEAPAEEAASP